jgi:hypothetical protein
MKKSLSLLLILAASTLALPAAAQENVLASQWTAAPVQIDGQAGEWPPDLLASKADYGVQYALRNDGNFLYCLFIFNDPKFMSSVEQSGLAFWINPEGKKKQTHGFRFYRKQVTGPELIQSMEKSGNAVPEERKKEILAKPQYMLFACDVLDKKGKVVPHPGTESGTYRVGKAQKSVIFECVVPLALLNDPAAPAPLDLSQPFLLGFEWGGSTEEMKKQAASRMGEQGAQAQARATSVESGISDQGGGSGANQSFGLSQMRRSIPKTYEFWVSAQLAAKK